MIRNPAVAGQFKIRVMVDCGKISDEKAKVLADDVAKRIQDEIEYPGQVKVTVLRELRAYDIAT